MADLEVFLETVGLEEVAEFEGAFCFGRTRSWKDAQGKWHCQQVPRQQWRFLKQQAHPGYLSWEQFLANQERLRQNSQAHGAGDHQAGPAREGPALLQGLALCGKCGRMMTVRYHHRGGRLTPDYVCQKDRVERTQPECQHIPGGSVDEAVGKLLVESVTPLALEVALNVQTDIQARLAEADRLRRQQVQRAEYQADQARVRYLRVDPNNRLVADTLETQWNEQLRILAQAREDYEKQRQLDAAQLTDEQRARILALAADFPRLWGDPKTPDRDRKRMARLLLEDVTLRRDQEIVVQARFRGGATRELRLPPPKRGWERQQTPAHVLAEIDRLLDTRTETQVAQCLNQQGWRSGADRSFTQHLIHRLTQDHGLPSRDARLRARGLLSAEEVAQLIACKPSLVDYWREQGLLQGTRRNEKNEYYYERPTAETVQQIKLRRRMAAAESSA